MTTPQFDTLRAAKTLKRGGFNETQAETVVNTLDQAVNENLGTKTDLKLLQAEVKQGFTETNAATEKAIAKTEAATEKAIIKYEAATEKAISNSEAATEKAIAKSEAATEKAIVKYEAAVKQGFTEANATTTKAIAEIRTAIADMRTEAAEKSEEKFTTLYRHLWVVGASIVVVMITLFLVN